MKLPILKLTNNITSQLSKISEELSETRRAYSFETPERFAQEVLDLGQAWIGLLLHTFEDLGEAKTYIDQHWEKLEQRGWEFDGEVEIKFSLK